jgi:hypothetical protein
MGLFDGPLKLLKDLSGAPQRAAMRAAPIIQAKLRADSTTKRGNVPTFSPGPGGHPSGTIPSTATASGGEVRVTAAEWVMAKAEELGQPAEWEAIAKAEADKSWWSRK